MPITATGTYSLTALGHTAYTTVYNSRTNVLVTSLAHNPVSKK